MEQQIKILLLEDELTEAALIMRILKKAAIVHQLKWVETRVQFATELKSFRPDIVIADNHIKDFNGMEALRITKEEYINLPFILITDNESEEFVFDAFDAGIDDYVVKTNLLRLPSSIKNTFARVYAENEKDLIAVMHNKLKLSYDEMQENNKNMTDSINYAKLIQEAMLPDKSILTNFFPNSLLIYRPKDIVSGDFYWFIEKDKRLLLAVADCTGHGVPGALMSMIGYSLLNEIVNVKKITSPAEILVKLNKGLRRALKQDQTGNQRCDGMDIGICSIDRENKEIEYSGANRHLIYFKDKELNLIKGNKNGIGGLYSETFIDFNTHIVNYDENDIIYLSTDGYADQMGGARGKRMMTKSLFRILEKSLSFGLIDQEDLLNHWLDKWKGPHEQTDDILLIGIQL
jgi:serine phosphatase RsbU (regulator of sigma subunit)